MSSAAPVLPEDHRAAQPRRCGPALEFPRRTAPRGRCRNFFRGYPRGYQTNWLTLNVGGRSYQLSRYRLYMAELGIFLSRDFLPYPNQYRAWSNNPVGTVDHNGLARESTEDREREKLIRSSLEKSKSKDHPIDSNGKVVLIVNDTRVDKVSGSDKTEREYMEEFRNQPMAKWDVTRVGVDLNKYIALAKYWNLLLDGLTRTVKQQEQKGNPIRLNGNTSTYSEVYAAIEAVRVNRIVTLEGTQQEALKVLSDVRSALRDGDTLKFETHSNQQELEVGSRNPGGAVGVVSPASLGTALKSGAGKPSLVLAGCQQSQQTVDITAKASGLRVSGSPGVSRQLTPDISIPRTPGIKEEQEESHRKLGIDIQLGSYDLEFKSK